MSMVNNGISEAKQQEERGTTEFSGIVRYKMIRSNGFLIRSKEEAMMFLVNVLDNCTNCRYTSDYGMIGIRKKDNRICVYTEEENITLELIRGNEKILWKAAGVVYQYRKLINDELRKAFR